MGLTPQQALEASVVVDMKELTGVNENVARVDIDVLLTENPDTFNLFLLALEDMQNDKADSLVGWFQVAGIHGRPRALWDNNGKQVRRETWDNVPKGFDPYDFGGYCAHGVLTFGPWHRPYLGLLEQSLYRRMRNIAELYTDPGVKSGYLAAAQKFRMPYFDYFRARGPGFSSGQLKGSIKDPDDDNKIRDAPPAKFAYDFRLPDIFNAEEVTIKRYPDNVPKTSPNPLYTYKFRKEQGGLQSQDLAALEANYSSSMTLRCAPQTAKAHGADQLRYNLNWRVQDRLSLLLDMLTDKTYQDFRAVGSDQLVKGDFSPSGSLEGSIHGTYHNLIGYGGQMEDPAFAAFDPIFWFHHCNIDRYFALWQAANPDDPKHPERWFPKPNPKDKKQTYDGEKPLWPFYRERTDVGKGKYWTSDLARDTTAFGYVYDDFTRMKTMKPPPASVGEYMSKRYSYATRKPNSKDLSDATMQLLGDKVKETFFFKDPKDLVATPASGKTSNLVHRMAADAAPVHGLQLTSVPAPPVPPNSIEPVFDRDWYVDSKVKRMAANGTFTIYFFISPHGALPDDEPFQYAASPYLVGQHHVFTASREGCENCAEADAEGRLSVSTTPITFSLLHYREDVADNGVDSLRPEHITPFLEKHLRWRVVFHGFERKDPRLADLELQVGVSAKVYHDDADPTYENYPEVVSTIIANAN